MEGRIAPLGEILNLNTRLFFSCLKDVDEEAGRKRISASNNMTFLAAHLVDARRFLGQCLGLPAGLLPEELLPDAQSIEDVEQYPSLELLKGMWQSLSKALIERFTLLSGQELDAPFGRALPIEDGSTLGAIAFMLQHESYHIGQLSLLRRLLGLEAMSYF